MRILILSGNTGEGHNSAARAIRERCEAHGDACDIVNGLAYLGRLREAVVCHSHVLLYRFAPKLYGWGYRMTERVTRRKPFQGNLERRRRLGAQLRALKARIDGGGYDAVLCTHVFAAALVSKLKHWGEIDLPCCFLATDYTCSPGVNQLDMDAWLIPHAALIPEFTERGIPEEGLIPTGIPVSRDFLFRRDQSEARQSLGLPREKRIAVLSCGSMGGGPMGRMVLSILKALPEDALLVAVCGSNRALEGALHKLVHSPKLQVQGFVERMSDYMDAADLFLTKPGGLSVSEAAHKGVPMLLYDAVPGCESRNIDFLASLGCAVAFHEPHAFAGRVASMLTAPEALRSLQQSCAREFPGDPAERIWQVLRRECARYQTRKNSKI